jgi:ATP-dependent Clp protease protease subunit
MVRHQMEDEKKATSRIRSPQRQWFQNQSRGSNPPWEYSICGDLTERQSDLLEHFTEVPRGSKGVIYFDSCGGSVYTGLSLGTLIRLRSLRVTAVVIGECSSAALIPFAACKQRLVTPHSTLLFHPMRWQSDEDVRLEEATEWARHFKELETRMDTLLSTMMNVPHDLLQGWTRPGRFITGPELAAAGIASLFDPFNDSDAWKKVRYI